MKEYIEREAAVNAIMGEPTDAHYPTWYAGKIAAIPAAPVREVVTCGECVYWQQCSRERGFCDEIWNGEWTNRDDFCNHGKRPNMREPVADIDVGRKEEGGPT